MFRFLWKCFAAHDLLRARAYQAAMFKLLRSMGQSVKIDYRAEILSPQCVEIGNRVYIGKGCTFVGDGGLTIGDDCMIAAGCRITTKNHVVQKEQVYSELGYRLEPVSIGNNVWIGYDAVILPGVSIGEGAVIAAGAIVTRDVPSYEIWGGNPAGSIRSIEVNGA